MTQHKAEQDSSLKESSDTNLRTFLILCGVVTAIWFIVGILIYFLFPTWHDRGTFGDTFGAVNALFSGLAFAGIIYALLLQREELNLQRQELRENRSVVKAQLDEMRSSRVMQSQPLALPIVKSVEIQRPRFFYTPPEDRYSAQSRYTITLGIQNPTQFPCIALNIKAVLNIPKDNVYYRMLSNEVFVECVVPESTIEPGPKSPSFAFSVDEDALLFASLRQPDPRKVPSIEIEICYKNITGAHFRVTQAFRVYLLPTQAEIVGEWHTAVAGFKAKFNPQLIDLKNVKSRGGEGWNGLFDGLQEAFNNTMPSKETYVFLRVEKIPASFNVKQITEDDYENSLAQSHYSQLVILPSYDCPADIDSRKKSLK